MSFTASRKFIGVLVSLVLIVSHGSAHAIVNEAGPVQPTQWPYSEGLQPRIDGWDNALRIWGPDRYQTSLAASLALRGNGDFPFDTPDPSSASAEFLSLASDWWGAGRCPRSILLVAGDSPADSLVAASLSDPTGQSSEPYLRRSAAADPLFFPVGGFGRVDTDFAPVLVTASSRSGSASLSLATKIAIQDLRTGGCPSARQAIIVGGPSAVPEGVESELIAMGVNEVFRIGGKNRFSTAAGVADALGTELPSAGRRDCEDESVADGDARMGFYANAAIEYRSSATDCSVLVKTVVLADGVAGADALAAGWWTSFWQVPVLLHDGSSELPPETARALQSLDIANIVILGGERRIPSQVALQAEQLSNATALRVAGQDRYQTSIEMARFFGGWWPTGRSDEYTSSIVCLAGSSGSGTSAKGWPDALGAGPWCAAASGGAGNPGTPQRALTPLQGGRPAEISQASRPGHDAVPVLLVPAGRSSLPIVTQRFLADVFEPADNWCSSVARPPGCGAPGFVVVFGGSSTIPDSVVASASALVSGGRSRALPADNPKLRGAFFTGLSMTPVYRESGSGPVQVCLPRGGMDGARWLAAGVGDSPGVTAFTDVMMDGWYVADSDEVRRTGERGSPGCLRFGVGDLETAWIRSVGPSGRSSLASTFAVSLQDRFTLTGQVSSQTPSSYSGIDTKPLPGVTGESILVLLSTQPEVGLLSDGYVSVVESAGMTLTLLRSDNVGGVTPDIFEASWNLTTTGGTVFGRAEGEAIYEEGIWNLRGFSEVLGGSIQGDKGIGGFSANLATNQPGTQDDQVTWQFDASR